MTDIWVSGLSGVRQRASTSRRLHFNDPTPAAWPRNASRLHRGEAEFLGKVLHELRGSVGNVVMHSATLAENAERLPPEVLQAQLSRLAEQGERLRTLTERLLDVSRIAGSALEAQCVLVGDFLADVLHAEPLPEGCQIEIQVADDLEIVTDPVSLQQIVGNLLRNAYVHGGSCIALEAERSGDKVRFTVVDDGPGVDETQRATLFSPFVRGDRQASGWGLGLAIVSELAQALDGDVAFEPNAPRGARFTVTLPA